MDEAPVAAPEPVESQAPQPTLPPKYAGKSAEDLARMLEDQEKHLGRQANELGELRQRSQQYENWLAQAQMAQAQQQAQTAHQAPEEAPDGLGKFDWENPEREVNRRVEKKLKTEMESMRRSLMMETAAAQAPIAKNMAKNMYPDAFRDVTDEELDRAMFGGAAAGNVQPQNLTKPEAWRMLGWILQGEKRGYKMQPGGVNPVSPTSTESPVSAKPQNYGEEPIAIDEQARAIIRGFGRDEADVLKSMRGERKGR